jgi:enoyl-CoA hydratase/carnithine racemase
VPISEAMDIEGAAFNALFWSADAREGVFAFVEKRKADFIGE